MDKKSVKEVLRQLMTGHKISENELAKRTSLNQPTIHRLLTGETSDPRVSTLLPLAGYFDVPVEVLVGQAELNLNTMEELENLEGVKPLRYSPVLSWDEARSTCLNGSNPPDNNPKRAVFSDAGYRSFWLQIRGNAMLPVLRDKRSYVCIDPDRMPGDSFIGMCLVHQKDTDELMVRELLVDGSLKTIKTAHPDFPFRESLDDRFTLCGLVTEDQHAYTT